jgi:hypothetical protein
MSERFVLPTRRSALAIGLTAGGLGLALGSRALADVSAVTPPSATVEGLIAASGVSGDVHDWDYHMGRWTVANRRLRKRWTSTPEWYEFPGETEYVKYMDGLVNVDETRFPTQGFAGVTLRSFSTEKRRWSIYWINSRAGEVTSPMIGGWKGDVGLFYGDDLDEGVPITARFIRTKRPPDGERWEQAFSKDGGKSWETNWTGDFTRVRT